LITKNKNQRVIKTSQHKLQISGFMLERTTKLMKRHFQQKLAAAGVGVTVDQWVVLQELDRKNGLSQLEIARLTFKDAPTVTRIIDLLCEKQLTRREPDERDRRRFKIVLTEQGKAKIQKVLPIAREMRSTAWHGLTDDDMDQLVQTLNTIFENLENSSDQ